ncbi:hypothetical protein PDE_04305 [Penicillium oxalicum 114-2]|uniref:HNH nuclease domain-containing protein n=1 Tax=Penicillium oxalicum (strain 114-2 / CGMCC 5302) TaxID=933388 RepID=S7ZL23_PENO1|nr:hypothetical protein PDE_04305 [Penicillium oxalicum 114-2]
MDSLSESSGSLSLSVPDAEFDTYAAAREKMFARLDVYQSLNAEDDTVHFLSSVFRFLPIQGQVHLADDADNCDNDDRLRQLAKHLDTALLRLMMITGENTPAITPSPRLGVEDSIKNLLSQDFDSATRRQGELRQICLQRDNHHNEDVNRVDNVMMLAASLHRDSGRFSFILEETDVFELYHVKVFSQFRNSFLRPHMPEFTVVASHDPRYPAPNTNLLAVHAAIGNILHATGYGELIAKTIKHLGGSGGYALAKDGSTNVEELLSVTSLPIMAMNPINLS